MVRYDVVIIGAGPAGSSAAKVLEEKGYNLLIVDKELFPRNKPCAGVLSPKISSLVDVPEYIRERPLDGYRVFSPSGVTIESSFPQKGSIVDRGVFDDYLVGFLKKPPTQVEVKEITEKNHCLEVKGEDWRCEASCIIGADGANSVVRKYCSIPRKRVALAAQYVIKLHPDIIDRRVGNWFEVYYTLNYGYGWISPMKNYLKVGVGIISDYLKGSIWQVLDKFMMQPNIKKRSQEGKIVRREMHVIPTSGPLDKLTGKQAILVGDAGGFVFPGTGEGIFYAIKTGRIAASILDQAIANYDLDAESLEKRYVDELNRNGLLGLRDVDFMERFLANSESIERYVRRLRHMIQSSSFL
jgi:geranylgeranyl reductase family protein